MADRIPALTLWRPWPTCILRCGKDIENRGWATKHRGWIWLHAGKRFDRDALDYAAGEGHTLSAKPADHPTGIVGIARLIDVCDASVNKRGCDCGPWAMPGQYHWALSDVRTVPVVPCNGGQKLWLPGAELGLETPHG